MSKRPPSSVCIDDDSFFPLIETALGAQTLLDEFLRECRHDEDSFRNCWCWLDSRDRPAPIAEAALNSVVARLSVVVSHIHAFHGCRVTADSSYHTEGIKPLAADWIAAEIRKWAGNLPAPNSCADMLQQDYLRNYSGKVCAVKSLAAHQEHGGYRHALGSETLRNILDRHCPSALARMLQPGEPSIIEFTIPVPDLEDKAWHNFVSDMLQIWLSRQVEFPCPGDPRYGGIVLCRGVPPDWLVRRHICDGHGVLTGKVCNY